MKLRPIIVITLLLLMAGCTTTTGTRIGTSSTGGSHNTISSKCTLYDWVEGELLAYLSTELTRNPRLSGRPFLVAGLQDGEISTEIDDLTNEIRLRLMTGLARTKGINLLWQSALKPWEHHRSLQEVGCVDQTLPEIYIGIDCKLLPASGDLQVTLWAMDLREEMWITGFGASWIGPATREQRTALSHRHVDEHLRGLRPLPFTEDQVDLVASYLARKLSCLIRDLGEDILVYQENVNQATTSGRVFGLVDNYLNQFREVKIIERKDKANVLMKREVQPITGDLYQIWIHSVLRKNGMRLPGTDTEVYLTLSNTIRLSGAE
ncbi:MAG: hypothetical protein ACLFV2_04265 [Desulfurivibrionaceae bacterium]